MRKQNKIVAVASAAALLAIGASMTSFAATGWVEEDGTWYFYDRDGSKVEDEWKKSGDNWYWLDSEENGAMATDKLIEDGDNTYYVDSNGVMVTNTWVKVVNEDQDDDDDPAEYRYYYMQNSGKAYKATGDSSSTKTKTIDGKKYAFDADGKMLYGWVNASSELVNDDEGWKGATYYFGSWEDGSMKTGWQKITVFDAYGDEDDDADKWFYFKSNGKKQSKADDSSDEFDTKKINNKTYGFDDYGVMVYEWNKASGSDASASNWGYFNSPEDGARVTKGWFKVVPEDEFDHDNSEEGDEVDQWYYSNGDGTLETSKIKKIKGKYYAFNERGAMMSGLVLLNVEGGTIVDIGDDGVDSDELDDIRDDKYTFDYDYSVNKGKTMSLGDGYTLYYFGDADSSDNDGAMKTGNTTVKTDGSTYSFHFSTTGGADSRGAGTNGIIKKVYYKYGRKMAASTDDKYRAVSIDVFEGNDVATFKASKDLRADYAIEHTFNSNGTIKETIKYVDLRDSGYSLIGTNGSLKTKAKGVKDGDDWYFFSDSEGKITWYANSKDFTKTPTYKAAEE